MEEKGGMLNKSGNGLLSHCGLEDISLTSFPQVEAAKNQSPMNGVVGSTSKKGSNKGMSNKNKGDKRC